MFENEALNHYQVLDISEQATPQEIQEAYLRAKNAFKQNSPATYGVFASDENQDYLNQIEYAYEVLSDPERRRDYNERIGVAQTPRIQTKSYINTSTQASTVLSQSQQAKTKISSSELLVSEIESEKEWSGAFIRHVRETRGITIEDLSSQTKISKAYLDAIESEEYTKLPAPVFVRGFLIQISKALKIPSERMTQAYLQRLKQK
jgi:DnaJ-class molecular chaperone